MNEKRIIDPFKQASFIKSADEPEVCGFTNMRFAPQVLLSKGNRGIRVATVLRSQKKSFKFPLCEVEREHGKTARWHRASGILSSAELPARDARTPDAYPEFAAKQLARSK